jgi:Ser/Thr protein kinase RdoA (MazF antagonist)
LPGTPAVRGPVEVLRVKRWGATGLFEVGGEYVVVKHASPVVYPHAAAVHRAVERAYPQATAELLAHGDDPVWQRSVFAYVNGPTVEKVGPAALVTQARTLGEVQSAMADVDLTGLPQYDLSAIPETLLADLSRVADLDDDLVARLRHHLPALQRGIEELIAAVPLSIDHPDIQGTNGLVRDDGSVVLLDWEEARVGCPMISLDRLRQEADEVGNVPEVMAAYLDVLPWGTAAEKRRLADIALQVAPLKLAVEAREYARTIGLPHPHTRYVTTLVTRSLSRLVAGAQLPG